LNKTPVASSVPGFYFDRLTPEELSLYNDLRDNRIREGLRLEQEHLSFGWVQERIDQLLR
jgi:hypothetical protein